ncbi:MAG TPA: M14 family zinc carboxypeptidase [Actinomycetota bacterium]|nr:M14 family zinc carboxypeptidase [Actinomycetota bacterium]
MYRTIAQLDGLSSALATWFPQYFDRVELPEPSVQGRPVYALRMRAGEGEDRRAVLLVGGTHARELMNPDAIVELAVDLLVSYENGSDIDYGGMNWPANTIKLILETLDIWLLPCSNPDGRQYVMTVDDLWRKNRRDNAGTNCEGVDLNRNLDFMWGVTEGQTSCSPCTDIYCGPEAFSEPETRNVKHLLDSNDIDTFADVHSYSELILHPWGHAPTQTADSSQRFTNLPTGTCTLIGIPGYQEYMPPRDLLRFETVGGQIVEDVADVRGRNYTSEPSLGLYATTGTHSDYVYGRHIADPGSHKTYGYTFETGPWTGDPRTAFHPDDPEPIKLDAKAAMLSLIQQSICAIELIGWELGSSAEVAFLRRIRDQLNESDAGKEWVAMFESQQSALGRILLSDPELAAQAARLLGAGKLLDADAVAADEDVDRAQELIRLLSERAESESLRNDLQRAGEELDQLRGVSRREAVKRLMDRPPEGGKSST